MIAEGSNVDLATSVVIHVSIPVIDVDCQLAVLGGAAVGTAALEPPSAIFMAVAMVTAHTSHYMVYWTHEQKRQVKGVLIDGPEAVIESSNMLAGEVPAPIFMVVAMVTLDSIESLIRMAVNIEVVIEPVLPSSHSTEH